MEEKNIRKHLEISLIENEKEIVSLPITSPELVIGLLSSVTDSRKVVIKLVD